MAISCTNLSYISVFASLAIASGCGDSTPKPGRIHIIDEAVLPKEERLAPVESNTSEQVIKENEVAIDAGEIDLQITPSSFHIELLEGESYPLVFKLSAPAKENIVLEYIITEEAIAEIASEAPPSALSTELTGDQHLVSQVTPKRFEHESGVLNIVKDSTDVTLIITAVHKEISEGDKNFQIHISQQQSDLGIIIKLILKNIQGPPQNPVDNELFPTGITYYVCDTDGDDSFAGTSPQQPWKTLMKALTAFSTINAGETIAFCRQGHFDIPPELTAPGLVNFNCSAAAPCTLRDYPVVNSRPSDYPQLKFNNGNGFVLTESGDADYDAGYTFKNLYLRGNSSGAGIFVYNDSDDITVDNLVIDNFGIGIQLAGSNPIAAPRSVGGPVANQINERFVLKNSKILNNPSQGILGSCNDCFFEKNLFQNNGYGQAIYNHNIYMSGSNHLTIKGNTLYQSAFINGQCQGVSLVMHGVNTYIDIEDNLIFEDAGKATGNCWGIAIDPGYTTEEKFSHITIRNNSVFNMGNISIGCASCEDVLIENNKIRSATMQASVIAVPDRTEDTFKSAQVTIRGNIIDIPFAGAAASTGISVPNDTTTINTQQFSVLLNQRLLKDAFKPWRPRLKGEFYFRISS